MQQDHGNSSKVEHKLAEAAHAKTRPILCGVGALVKGWEGRRRGWHHPLIRCADGTTCIWRPVLTSKPGGSGKDGGVVAIDKEKDLKAAVKTHKEVMKVASQ